MKLNNIFIFVSYFQVCSKTFTAEYRYRFFIFCTAAVIPIDLTVSSVSCAIVVKAVNTLRTLLSFVVSGDSHY